VPVVEHGVASPRPCTAGRVLSLRRLAAASAAHDRAARIDVVLVHPRPAVIRPLQLSGLWHRFTVRQPRAGDAGRRRPGVGVEGEVGSS
jgi:hypothetical protein